MAAMGGPAASELAHPSSASLGIARSVGYIFRTLDRIPAYGQRKLGILPVSDLNAIPIVPPTAIVVVAAIAVGCSDYRARRQGRIA